MVHADCPHTCDVRHPSRSELRAGARQGRGGYVMAVHVKKGALNVATVRSRRKRVTIGGTQSQANPTDVLPYPVRLRHTCRQW